MRLRWVAPAWLERGECCDTAAPETRRGAKSGASSQARGDVVTAAVELSKQGPVAPGDIARFLAGRDLVDPPSRILRGIVRRLCEKGASTAQCRKGGQRPFALTWSAAFTEYCKSLREDPVMRVSNLEPGPTIVSLAVILVGLFSFLKDMHQQETLGNRLVCHTFRVEVLGYTWGAVGIALHRCLGGRWRKTFIPLVYVCFPAEKKRGYSLAFRALKHELLHWGLPMMGQLCCDHFGGIPRQFRKHFQGNICTSLWHLKKNLRRNQGVQQKRRRPRLSSADMFGKAVTYVCFTAILPTPLMFGLFWSATMKVIRDVWQQPDWARYFQKEYLRSRLLGGRILLYARWHYGAAASSYHGHGPSQQPVEQSHANFKRSLGPTRQHLSLESVLSKLRNATAAWMGPPEDRDRSFSLTASRDRCGNRPSGPDAWMMKQQSHILYVAAMRKFVRVSPIVAFYRSARSQPSTCRRKGLAPARCFYAMGLLQPTDIPPNWLDDAVAQTQARTCDRLEAVWERLGIRVQEEIGDDLQWKVQFSGLRKFWSTAALVVVGALSQPDAEPTVRCTCPLSCSYGHCVHEYAVMEMHGIRTSWGSQLPRAEEGAAALRRMPSSSSSSSSTSNSSDTTSEDGKPLVCPPALPASAAHA